MPAKKKQLAGVPEWAKDAIWYQIFPERFRNGSRKNDPRLVDMGVDREIKGWGITPWGGDWYKQAKWEKPIGDFFRSVYLRRYGGDLIGIREKLDYLEELGVNAIYLNPVFHAQSLHKYDASSMHHIDPTLGPDRDGDFRMIAKARETEDPKTWVWTKADRYFLELVADIHRRGMRVIIDGVFNHTGRDFFAFRDILKNGRKSRYRDWYKIKKWNPDGTIDYDGWFGHKALPEFGRTEENLARPVRKYIFDITARWMDPDGDGDPSDGVDGWRLDVAFCVPHLFWKQWRRHVKKLNPEGYTTAEIVTLAEDYLKGDEFDAVMNYMWLFPTVNFFSPNKNAIPVNDFRKGMELIRKTYPEDVSYVLQNLTDSHDVGRIATMIENAFPPIHDFGQYFELTRVHKQRDLITTKPSRKTYDIMRQIAVFQATYLGAPMIYYGTEVGMWGANDPCDRQPMLWSDIKYEAESMTVNGKTKSRKRAPDMGLFRFYAKAFALRTQSATLRRGTLHWVKTASDRLAAYERRLGSSRILVLLNASDREVTHAIKTSAMDIWENGREVSKGMVSVPPRGWRVLQLSFRT